MSTPQSPEQSDSLENPELRPACMMSINANDPLAAGGMGADVASGASMGVHTFTVISGTYIRDSSAIVDFYSFDEDVLNEQSRTILEDGAVQAFKIGFLGNTENTGVVAEVLSDYPDVPVIAYMPDLSWWSVDQIEHYLDAFAELILPFATILVGNASTLGRWLLPDWASDRPPTARDIAQAASQHGVQLTLVTGIHLPGQFIQNTLSSADSVLHSEKFEQIEAVFHGAGETLSACLCALIASEHPPHEAAREALSYLDRSLLSGFTPGMGQNIPDRLFWAQSDEEEDNSANPHSSATH